MRLEDLETLERIRKKVAERRELEEQRMRVTSVYKSPRLTGMPGGKNAGGSEIERKIDAKDMLDRRIAEIDAEIDRLTETVRETMNGLPAHLYSLVSTYYLSALSVNDTCRVTGRGRATFFRHQRELRHWGNETQMRPK